MTTVRKLIKEMGLKYTLVQIETEAIMDALDKNYGRIASAARDLKLKRTTLVEKMRRLQIDAGDFKDEG